jgi:hypothetical protein
MIPFPNYTTHNSKVKKQPKGIITNFFYGLRKILLPLNYNKLNDKGYNHPFLQIKNIDAFFDVPAIEAFMTSRWKQTKRYWMTSLWFYIVFLFLFSFLSNFFLNNNNDDENKRNVAIMIMTGIFYYVGMYLLIIEFMRIKKYKLSNYFSSIFSIFDLCSIMLGVITFTLIFIRSFDETIGINNEGIVILTTITTLVLWIEMVCILTNHFVRIYNNVYINLLSYFSSSFGYDYLQI